MIWPLLLVGCVAYQAPGDSSEVWSAAELRDDRPPAGTRLRLGEAVVISPRTADGAAFYVQDPGGGADSGLQVRLAGAIAPWPPPVGTPVTLVGTLDWIEDDPALWLTDRDDGAVLGEPEPPATAAWDPAAGLAFALVAADFVTIASDPDPTGRADTDAEASLVDAFGVPLPGWGAVGDLVGVAVAPGAIAPRAPGDWAGPLSGDPPVEAALDELETLPEGTPVVVDDAVVATPFSTDERWVVLQDPAGRGLWVDTEGFALERPAEGDRVRWAGEVRTDDEGLRLRTWHTPTVTGTGTPIVAEEPSDGALIHRVLTRPGDPDRWGRRTTAEGVVLDGRFAPVDVLPDPVEVTGPVRVDAEGTVILHPVEFFAP